MSENQSASREKVGSHSDTKQDPDTGEKDEANHLDDDTGKEQMST